MNSAGNPGNGEYVSKNKYGGDYAPVMDFARSHYENFPVVSFLIPSGLRKHVAAIYWFARTADDMADEGSYTPVQRLDQLELFEERLTCTLRQNFSSRYDECLYYTIEECKLTPVHFFNLLKAFKQDVVKKRYASFSELLEYCTNSANPVGRLMLEIFNIRDIAAGAYSDRICTALQLTNFLQDSAEDYTRGRIYLPQEELSYFRVEENDFGKGRADKDFKNLIAFNVERIRKFFEQGRNILPFLHGRFRLEIKWTIAGGEEVLHKIKKIDYNVLEIRPSLTRSDFLRLLIKSII